MSNQRQFVRLQTRQQAMLLLADGSELSCEIRNFCPTGFLIVAAPGSTNRRGVPLAEALPDQAPVAVVFGAGDAKERPFQVSGRVAHQSAAGIGVFSDTLGSDAFQALLTFRANLYREAGDERPADLDPADAQTIRAQCLSLFRPFLGRLAAAFFQQAEDQLALEIRSGANLVTQTPLQTGLMDLRPQQSQVEARFVEAALARVGQSEAASGSPNGESEVYSLSLVEEDEFDDWLNVTAVVSRVEEALFEYLAPFERLYGLLRAQADEADRSQTTDPARLGETSPFSPASLGGAFQETLSGSRLNKAQRAALYRVFGQALIAQGPGFYADITKLAAVVERRRDRPGARRVAPEPPTADNLYDGLDNDPATLGPWNAPARQTYASAPLPPDKNLLHTTDMLLRTVGQLMAQVPAGMPPVVPVAMPAPGLVPLAPGAGVPLTGSLMPPLSPPAGTLSGSPMAAATTQDLVAALDALLAGRRGPRPAQSQPALTQLIQAQIAQAGRPGAGITPQQQQTLDSLAGLFDSVMREYVPTSELERLIQRFEPLFFKLALQDPDFLNADQHPARQVLNLLDRFAVACDDDGKFHDAKLPHTLGFLMDTLQAKAEHDPGAYQKTADTLERMLQPLEKLRTGRIYRLQEMCEGRRRILQARRQVTSDLERLLGGRDVPAILIQLLDAGLRHYLGLLELRVGPQDGDWQAAIGLVARIQAWFSPDFVPPDDADAQVRQLVLDLRHRLATVSVDAQRLDGLLAELEDHLTRRVRDPLARPDLRRLEAGRLLRGQEEEAASASGPLAGQLALGIWWNLVMDSGKPAPMQLVWMSQPPGELAFANRSGTRKLDLTLAELTRRAEAGEARSATDKDLPLLERSEGSLIDVVYRHLAFQTTHDPVTQLINHKGFLQKVRDTAALQADQAGRHSLWVMEFDQLRLMTYQQGPDSRDQLLRALATAVRGYVRPQDTLGLLGDDRFAAFLPDCDADEGERMLGRIMDWMQAYRHGEASIQSVGANAGLVDFSPGSLTPEEMLSHADAACVRATGMGRYQYLRYVPEDVTMRGQESLLEWASRMDRIVDSGGLYLRCQRVCPIQPGGRLLPYYEILLGVQDVDGTHVPPQQFIQAAEKWKRVHDIDHWVVTHALEWMRANPVAVNAIGGLSINLSAVSLASDKLLAYLHDELSRPDLPVDKVMFEITETGTIGSYAHAQEFIRQLKGYGCRFGLDDFGSGFASYGHLKNLNTDTLKIDGIFVMDMLNNAADYAMVKSMKEVGHSLGMKVVAEFVATPEILSAVRDIGVDYAQGYALHRPMPITELAAELERGWTRPA